MIGKIFHLLFFILFSIIVSLIVLVLYYAIFLFVYKIDILAPQLYITMSKYWNSGGIIRGKDAFMILLMLSYIPICMYLFYKIYHCKYMNIIMKPILWLNNFSMRKYGDGSPSVNIKNLKIEEKKTIEDIVQERIEQENKKSEKVDTGSFRKAIIEKIENNLK